MIFLVKDKKISVGRKNKSQKPFLTLTCGYQVRTILIRNVRVQAANSRLAKKCIFGSASNKIGVTKL